MLPRSNPMILCVGFSRICSIPEFPVYEALAEKYAYTVTTDELSEVQCF